MFRQRVRIRFRKEGDLRLIGHLDLVRACERMFRRAGLPLRMSEGYHPKPVMTFPTALALGIAGADEMMELEMIEPLTADDIASRLTAQAPAGLSIEKVEVLPQNSPKGRVQHVTYELPIPSDRAASLTAAIDQLLATDHVPFAREGRAEPVDIRQGLELLELCDGHLRFRLCVDGPPPARPREILETLKVADLLDAGFHMTRTRVELAAR